MAPNLNRDKTLHRRILTDIEQKIVSGQWQPGYRLPIEVDLASSYGCSRMTANKVLTQLAQSGLIERRRKFGSYVCHPRSQSAVIEISDIETEVASLNLPYAVSVLSRTVRKAKRLETDADESWSGAKLLEVSCLHSAAGRPFCLETRLISLEMVPEATDVDFSSCSPGKWLTEQVPWTSAEHKIFAAAASTEAASSLGIERGAACLTVERRTWKDGTAITKAIFTYPASNHAVVARFTPAGRD